MDGQTNKLDREKIWTEQMKRKRELKRAMGINHAEGCNSWDWGGKGGGGLMSVNEVSREKEHIWR